MHFLKNFWPTPFKIKKGNLASFLIQLVIFLVITALLGWLAGLLAKIAIIGWIFGILASLLGVYNVIGIVLCVLRFVGVV